MAEENINQELERLRKENEELKKKLGIPAVNTPAPLHESFLNSFEAQDLSEIDAQSPTGKKIHLFRSLFRGREDVYATYWVNERLGKKGYSPAKAEPWDKQSKKYLPLTDQVIKDHFDGIKTIGAFPLLMDNTCWFLACDFDNEGWTLDAIAFTTVCKQHGIPVSLERSRSGNGGHVWIFFSSPVRATDARQLGMRLLRETMVLRAELDLGSYDRFFPNQDFVPRGGFGNLIALPLQNKPCVLGNTMFIDPDDPQLKPWPDQWLFLSHIQKISPLQLEALLEKIPSILWGPGTSRKVSQNLREKYPAPKQIRCFFGSKFSVEKSGIPPWMLSELKHVASVANPEFFRKQNMRYSTYGTPAFIKCYSEDMSYIHLPRGMEEEISEIVEQAGSKLLIDDRRPTHKKLSFEFSGTLTPSQEAVMKTVLRFDMGVLVAPPGAGKTVMGCYAIAKRNLSTLILVHRKPILEQWREQISNLLGINPDDIGQVGGGKENQTGVIDLAMLQSLKRLEDLEEFFAPYGFIIVDECHHLPAITFEATIKNAPIRYILGLTATLERRDKLHGLIAMQCGSVRQKMIVEENALVRLLNNHETQFNFFESEQTSIQDIFRSLVQNEARTRLIVEDIDKSLAGGRRCLVLSHWKEHCDKLAEALTKKGRNPYLLVGTLGKKERAAIIEEIQNLPPEKELVIVATGQYLGEGFDCPQLDSLFMAFPISFKGKQVQYVGRILREYSGKEKVVVYDYVDSQVPVLKKMHARRLKIYKQMKFSWMDENELPLFQS